MQQQCCPLEQQVLDGCRRLAAKGILNSVCDNISIRIPGTAQMIIALGVENWRNLDPADIGTKPFMSRDAVAGLHGSIYLARPDVGAIAVSSPTSVRLLAIHGRILPSIFDEQVRHLGRPATVPLDEENFSGEQIRRALSRGANAILYGDRLLSLGMTCERLLLNTERFEKCAQAYVIAKACGFHMRTIPPWVRLVANHRLQKEQRNASAQYGEGRYPEAPSGY